VLFSLEQDGGLTRLELGPLPTDAVTELARSALGSPPPPPLVAWLGERARGNPLFVLSLLQALLDENADLAAPRLHRLPEGLTERVAARLGTVAEPARETLDLLAVVGRRVRFAELMALTGRAEEELGPILDSLSRSPLITHDERGGELSYEIAHPIVQEAIYQSLGATRRRAAHRQVGRSLLADGRLGEAAPHIARSAEPGDSDAIDALCSAVRQAESRHAYREALIILGSLAEVLPADDDRWLGVLDDMVLDADWIFDHRADVYGSVAVPALRAIDGLLGPSFDTARRAALKFRLGTFLIWGTGQLEEAERVNTEARRLFEAAGDRSAALLAKLEEASIHFARGNLAAWVPIGRAVADEAEAAGEPLVAMHAIGRGIGWGAVAHGDFDEADAAFQKAVSLARENGKPYFQSLSQLGLAYSLGLQGRIDRIEPLLHEAKAVNPCWQEGSILEFEAVLRWVAGDFESTLRCARESMAWNVSGKSRRRGFAMAFAAMAATETGRPAEAERFLAVAQAAYEDRPWASYTDLVRVAQAVCDWRARHDRRSLSALEEAAMRILEMEALPWAAFALCELGDVATESRSKAVTARAATALEGVADRLDRNLYRGLAALARAGDGLVSQRYEDAAGAATEALERIPLGYRVFSARAREFLGRALVPVERTSARDALKAAAMQFDQCGATTRRDRALERLRRLGEAGKRAAAPIGVSVLTVREQDVARLAVLGQTAPEIARSLVIGTRTVETHLVRIYAKLGVGSKRELVRRASDFGLPGTDGPPGP
jgi:ATP/maltotriose-dependent transcriptional regulator MalT